MFSILNRALSWAIISFGNKFCPKMRSRLIKALNNRFYVKFMQLEIGLFKTWSSLVSGFIKNDFVNAGSIKARSHDPFLRIRFLMVPKIRSCEHIENDISTHGSVSLKKRMQIEHALFSSNTLLERYRRYTVKKGQLVQKT